MTDAMIPPDLRTLIDRLVQQADRCSIYGPADALRATIRQLALRSSRLEAGEVRCAFTGNPCGTDTWMVGQPCRCAPCQQWIARQPPR